MLCGSACGVLAFVRKKRKLKVGKQPPMTSGTIHQAPGTPAQVPAAQPSEATIAAAPVPPTEQPAGHEENGGKPKKRRTSATAKKQEPATAEDKATS